MVVRSERIISKQNGSNPLICNRLRNIVMRSDSFRSTLSRSEWNYHVFITAVCLRGPQPGQCAIAMFQQLAGTRADRGKLQGKVENFPNGSEPTVELENPCTGRL